MNKVKKYIIGNIVIFSIIFLLYFFGIKICPIYTIFKIPCPGCGLTRAAISLLKGNIKKSLEYNFMLIPLVIMYVIYSIVYIYDSIKGEDNLQVFLKKHEKSCIIISIILFILIVLRNITNPILYQ